MSNNEEKYFSRATALIIAVLLIAVIILTSILIFRNPPEQKPQSLPTAQPSTSPELSESLIKSPTDLTASSITATKINLVWKDNSVGEKGLRLYRDGVIIANLPENTTIYEDINLKPTTTYIYKVEVYNSKNILDSLDYSTKTLNPPINVWIAKIGVHDNGEDFLRGQTGEVNLGVVISDNKSTVQIRLPETDYYQLKQDESVSVNQLVFSSEQVGDNLRVAIIGYENDGGNGEQFIYNLMEGVAKSYLGGPISLFLTLGNIDLSTIISNLFGGQNDWLGSNVSENTASNNWGVGKYVDIKCKNKDGNIGLILSLRIECPVYDYSAK